MTAKIYNIEDIEVGKLYRIYHFSMFKQSIPVYIFMEEEQTDPVVNPPGSLILILNKPRKFIFHEIEQIELKVIHKNIVGFAYLTIVDKDYLELAEE